MVAEPLVTAETKDRVGWITVRRPKALNALSAQVLDELLPAIVALSADPEVRVVLFTGEGERAFIAGADISEFVGATPRDALAIAARIRKVTDALVACPKPVVAVVNGLALGGGFELALACDIRIASSTARFGLPEINLGILPGGGGTVRLTQVAGSSVARHLTMTGEQISAARALELGIVASVHSPDQLAAAAEALAGTLATKSPFAMQQLKTALNAAIDAPTAVALDCETRAFALCYAHEDAQEGARAFLEKRMAKY
ncbi:MAG: enoyl-CoA hydratase/isomerase family protein [Rhizobiaceae bacterium]